MKFDTDKLAELLEKRCPQICFALLHGSAKNGTVKTGGDVDLALFVGGKPTLELYQEVSALVETAVAGARCDIGILNNADPVYRFEALKGKLLFCRDQQQYLDFFSLTCRQFESQMADYYRQQKYRLEKQAAAKRER